MLVRRIAAAIGLILAVVTSQLPEYVQQYRQRLGGAYDELAAIVADFDTEASRMSLRRDQALDRLKTNPDELARERGTDLETTIERTARLERQRTAFASAGPVSQYAVMARDFDPRLASQTYRDFQPAVPVTSAGVTAGVVGLVLGWLLTHAVAWPLRRGRRRADVRAYMEPAQAQHEPPLRPRR